MTLLLPIWMQIVITQKAALASAIDTGSASSTVPYLNAPFYNDVPVLNYCSMFMFYNCDFVRCSTSTYISAIYNVCDMHYVIACIYYVSKCKWHMYMYVNKRVELAQRGTAQ